VSQLHPLAPECFFEHGQGPNAFDPASFLFSARINPVPRGAGSISEFDPRDVLYVRNRFGGAIPRDRAVCARLRDDHRRLAPTTTTARDVISFSTSKQLHQAFVADHPARLAGAARDVKDPKSGEVSRARKACKFTQGAHRPRDGASQKSTEVPIFFLRSDEIVGRVSGARYRRFHHRRSIDRHQRGSDRGDSREAEKSHGIQEESRCLLTRRSARRRTAPASLSRQDKPRTLPLKEASDPRSTGGWRPGDPAHHQ